MTGKRNEIPAIEQVQFSGEIGVGLPLTVSPANGWAWTAGDFYLDSTKITDGVSGLTFTQTAASIDKVIGFVPTNPYKIATIGKGRPSKPGTPSIVATAGNNTVGYTITPHANNGGSAVIDYMLAAFRTVDDALIYEGTVSGTTGSLTTLNGIANAVQTYLKVRSRNTAGFSNWSLASNNVTPSPQIDMEQASSPYTLQASDNGKVYNIKPTDEFKVIYPNNLGTSFAVTLKQDEGDAYGYPITIEEGSGTTGFNADGVTRIKSSASQAEGIGFNMIRGPGKTVTLTSNGAASFKLEGGVGKIQHISDKAHYHNTTQASFRQIFSAEVHKACGLAGEKFVGAWFVVENCYNTAEIVITSDLTMAASLEYPIGPTTPKQQVKWNGGQNSVTMLQSGGKQMPISDYLKFSVPIPAQDLFRTNLYQSGTNGVIMGCGQQRDQLLSYSASTTPSVDYTMTQTGSQPTAASSLGLHGTTMNSPQGIGFAAIIAVTETGAIAIMGTSRDQPSNGEGPTIGGSRHSGVGERAIGKLGYAMMNMACSGDSMNVFVQGSNSSNRRARLKWVTPVLSLYNVNDLNSGADAAAIDAVAVTLKAMPQMVGRKLYGHTASPTLVLTTDRLTTVAGQSQSVPANEVKRVALNDRRRAGLPAGLYDGYVEIADIIETSRNSGLVKVSPRARKVTDFTISAGSNIGTSPSANFTPEDSGHMISGNWGTALTGTAQAGTTTTITLAASVGAINTVTDSPVFITSGTGAGQSARITAFNSTTKVATLDTTLTTAPDSTSVYSIPGLVSARMTYISATQVSLSGYNSTLAYNAVVAMGAGNSTAYINAYEYMNDTYLANHESRFAGELIEAQAVPPAIVV